ncbi:MAG: hypothetical protein PHQ86_09405 [Dehalococcoidales bacterium]|nr:hypothetical protein [Dehalococcoidales bacterium]
MLDVEMLICLKPHHKDCYWQHAKIRYPNERYLLLRDRLIREVKKTQTAYRITHWKFGVLVTIKFGHDNSLWIGEHEDALRQFALYGGD